MESKYNLTSSIFDADRFSENNEADPMSSLANLADVMLVLACGLMMALVTFWNVDLPNIEQLEESQMQQVNEEDVQKIEDQVSSTTNPYYELGRVYQDPITGKMYMLQETEDESQQNTADQTQQTNDSSE